MQLNLQQIRDSIPKELFQKDELRFLVSVAQSVTMTVGMMYLGQLYIPLTYTMLPIWIIFAIVTGTIWVGLWILAHECGHGSFSNNQYLNDILGFVLHTTLLVPYFSWQHSHSVHHSKTNHLTLGESFCPHKNTSEGGIFRLKVRQFIGHDAFAIINMHSLLILGWPLYFILGTSGGPARGFTSHFVLPNKLFPGGILLAKVLLSNFGLLAMFYILYLWAQSTSFQEVLAIYIGPYLVVNAWLILITFLQHTDKNINHYDETQWTWIQGALSTIDRNYPPFIDTLHHAIGTTHVLHHFFSDIPHYNAHIANIPFKKILGVKYNQDKRNIFKSFWESAKLAVVEHKGNGIWQHQ